MIPEGSHFLSRLRRPGIMMVVHVDCPDHSRGVLWMPWRDQDCLPDAVSSHAMYVKRLAADLNLGRMLGVSMTSTREMRFRSFETQKLRPGPK